MKSLIIALGVLVASVSFAGDPPKPAPVPKAAAPTKQNKIEKGDAFELGYKWMLRLDAQRKHEEAVAVFNAKYHIDPNHDVADLDNLVIKRGVK